MSISNKSYYLLATAICMTVLSLPSYARAGGAGVGYGNRGTAGSPAGAPGVPAAGAPGYGARGAGAPGVPAAGAPGYGARDAGAPGVPASGAPGYGAAGGSGANVNGGANRAGARR
jgi:DNA polymerase III subunit gamma/tau